MTSVPIERDIRESVVVLRVHQNGRILSRHVAVTTAEVLEEKIMRGNMR